MQRERGVSFEQAVMHVERGDLLDVIGHPNKVKFPHQKVLVVRMRDYVYAVPFVEEGDECFLKTIIPSRKLTRQYHRIGEDESES